MRARQQLNQTAQTRAANDLRALQQKQVAMGIQEVERKKQKADELNKYVTLQMSEDPKLDRDLVTYNRMVETGDKDGVSEYLKHWGGAVESLKKHDQRGAFNLAKKKFGIEGEYLGDENGLTKYQFGDNYVFTKDNKIMKTEPVGGKKKTPTTGAKTIDVVVDGKTVKKQWNPDTEKYDITVGGVASKGGVTVPGLTQKALAGDEEAKNLLAEMDRRAVKLSKDKAKAGSIGKIEGLYENIDVAGTGDAILAGKETIENVKNTFGVPIQEAVRKYVLGKEPDFNFVQPRAIVKSLQQSLQQQHKNLGMMGSFVKNINGQVDKLENISSDIVKRVGVRALDLPMREFNTRFIGSGDEQVMKAYMKEISAEIAKLAQGSAASIAQLPEENRKEWEHIHDVNLSMRELLIILNGTREMANIRLDSVQDNIDDTVDKMGNIRPKKGGKDTPTGLPEGAVLIGKSKGKNVYKTPDGRKFVEE